MGELFDLLLSVSPFDFQVPVLVGDLIELFPLDQLVVVGPALADSAAELFLESFQSVQLIEVILDVSFAELVIAEKINVFLFLFFCFFFFSLLK